MPKATAKQIKEYDALRKARSDAQLAVFNTCPTDTVPFHEALNDAPEPVRNSWRIASGRVHRFECEMLYDGRGAYNRYNQFHLYTE